MKKVLFLPEFIDQYLEISEVLYDKGYLCFKDSAKKYAEDLLQDIKANLPIKVKKNAPHHFERYGKGLFYSTFPHSKKTVWYVFYSIHKLGEDEVYLVHYIGNNHAHSSKMDFCRDKSPCAQPFGDCGCDDL